MKNRTDRRRSMEVAFPTAVLVPAVEPVEVKTILQKGHVPIDVPIHKIVPRKRGHSQIQWSEMACTLSHRKVLSIAAAMKCPVAIVMEDDIEPAISNPLQKMSNIFHNASRTDGVSAVQFITNNPNLRRLSVCGDKLRLRPLYAWGTAAYVVNAATLQYLLSKRITFRYALAEDFLFARNRTHQFYMYIGSPILRYKESVIQSDIQSARDHALTTRLSLSADDMCIRVARCTLVSVTSSCFFSSILLTLEAMHRVCSNVKAHVAYQVERWCVPKNDSSTVYYPIFAGDERAFVAKALFWDRLREYLPWTGDQKIWFMDDDIVLSDDSIRIMGSTKAGIVQPAINMRKDQSYKIFHNDSRHNRQCETSMLEQQVVAIAANVFHFVFEHPHTRQLLAQYRLHQSDWGIDWGIDCMW
eukprot:CAMPEP_0119300052 /NCGR_PEP_ID=MMETSP1333-20130426/2055_1 /TAXON_ID=418940 /ORGANISM="Scyphosphaera apsteinii, Strain RCC1455" /LENGTH=413 /DNA_ID=CAMNT_0007301685 /DNA_START=63 /DNA_END=1301 /DNA_ORIENTATION=-